MTSFHIAVIGDTTEPGQTSPCRPRWLRVAPRQGSVFAELPGFARYGRALLANDLVAATPGAVVLLADTAAAPESHISHCLRVLGQRSAPVRAFSWSDELDRVAGTGALSPGLFAIRRRDWDALGGLSEYLPFGFIGDLERRADRSAKPFAKMEGRLGDEASADDDIAYGVTLLGRVGGGRVGRRAAKDVLERLVGSGELSPASAREAILSAHAAVRDVRHLRRAQRERDDR